MTQRRSTKAGKPLRRAPGTPAPVPPISPATPVRSRFAVRLPGREPVPPVGGQDTPAWQLFYSFSGILSGIAHEIPGIMATGFVAFEVEAAYLDAPPGVIPEFEEGPLGVLLRQELPAVIEQESRELRTVIDIDQGTRRRIKVAAKFLRIADLSVNNDILLKFISFDPELPVPSLEDKLKELTQGLPEDYDGRAAALTEFNHACGRHLADQLAPALNAKVHGMPHATYEEKKALAKWVNDELRRFDLAIKCPKTGQPSLLLAGPGNHPEAGRFILEHKTSDGKRVRPVNSPVLPHLELMEANPRREALQEWRDRVGGHGGGATRA